MTGANIKILRLAIIPTRVSAALPPQPEKGSRESRAPSLDEEGNDKLNVPPMPHRARAFSPERRVAGFLFAYCSVLKSKIPDTYAIATYC